MLVDDAEKVEMLERAWMLAWIDKDRVTCEAILDEEFLLTSARGELVSRSDWLINAIGPFDGKSFEWLDIKVRLFGDTAIVHAKTRQQATVHGQDWSGVFLITDVWVRRGDSWKVVSRHGTGPLPA